MFIFSVLTWKCGSTMINTRSVHCHSTHTSTACSRSEPCSLLPLSNYHLVWDLCLLYVGNIWSHKKPHGRSYYASVLFVFLRSRLNLIQSFSGCSMRGCFLLCTNARFPVLFTKLLKHSPILKWLLKMLLPAWPMSWVICIPSESFLKIHLWQGQENS